MDNRKCHMEHFLLTHQPFLSQRAKTAGAPLDRELLCEGPRARQERGPPRRHVPHRKCDLAADPHQRSSASKRPTHEMLTFANETSRPPDRRAIRSAVSAPINKRPSVFPLTFQPVGAEETPLVTHKTSLRWIVAVISRRKIPQRENHPFVQIFFPISTSGISLKTTDNLKNITATPAPMWII